MESNSELKKKSILTDSIKKIPSESGKTEEAKVYKIPIELLKYNKNNGRIGSWLLDNDSKNIDLEKMDSHASNQIIEEAIKNDDKKSHNNTKNNIKSWGQYVPGVVLSDGTIIDGNRRFTCLRELNREKSNDDSFKFFDAAILDADKISPRYLKTMEWHLQLGAEERVNYDPIEILLDIYHNIIEKEEFTIEEYSKFANMDIKESKKKLNESFLLKDYLDHIKNSRKWSIAKEEAIEGSLMEINVILNRIKIEEEKNHLKEIMFDYLVAVPNPNISKYIRKIGKEIAKSDEESKNNFLDKHVNINKKIHYILSTNEDIKKGLKEIRDDIDIHNMLIENFRDLELYNHKKGVLNLPIKILKDFIKEIDNDLDDLEMKSLKSNENNEFFNLVDDILSRFNRLRNDYKK